MQGFQNQGRHCFNDEYYCCNSNTLAYQNPKNGVSMEPLALLLTEALNLAGQFSLTEILIPDLVEKKNVKPKD